MKRVNAIGEKLQIKDLADRGKDGDKGKADITLLTEAEKTQVAVLVERVSALQVQFNQVNSALSELIRSIVVMRGLDSAEFGVNLAAGRVLPIDKPIKGAG